MLPTSNAAVSDSYCTLRVTDPNCKREKAGPYRHLSHLVTKGSGKEGGTETTT